MPYKDWTPEEMAGAHIMAGFPGTSAPDSLLERIRNGRVGGIILFSRNIENAEQILELTCSLQQAAASSPHPAPLLISIDQEGGRVSRVSKDFTRFPAAGVFGRIGDEKLTRKAAHVTGTELRAVGVNMDFAPVVDLLTNPECTVIGDRAYGNEPDIVSNMAISSIEGLQSAQVAACAKHFPGIGEMAPDPHKILPFCDLSLEELRNRELLPYRAAFHPGLKGGSVASVLVAHAVYTQIDPDRTASFSHRIIGDLLRKEMGYEGLVVTDDLEMGAIEDPAEAALDSLQAGADIALICHSEDHQERALELIARGIRDGDISRPSETRSLDRIQRMKAQFGGDLEGYLEAKHFEGMRERIRNVVNCEAHRVFAQEIMERGHETSGT